MAEEESGGEKSHEPTQSRIDDARERGDIPRSQDVSSALAYFGLLAAFLLAGAGAIEGTGATLAAYFARAETLAPLHLGPGGPGFALGMASEAMVGLLPFLALPALFVAVGLAGQRAVVFAPEKLAPSLERISPISGAQKKFGLTGMVEFAKASVKLLIISVVLAFFLLGETDRIVGLARAEARAIPGEMAGLAAALLLQIALVVAAVAAVDWVWQQFDHMRKLRMTYQELREEAKRAEGDPQLKAQRRRRAEEIANNRMMLDVPKAAVVIVNPTHYAVALKWDRTLPAPVVVAKGVDGVALRIRERAEAAGVPIHSDPPTARALHAAAEVGHEIEPKHYHAVAAAIRFAESMRVKMKARGR